MEPRVYLAGPDVFLIDPADLLGRKQRLCRRYGFLGLSPLDTEVNLRTSSKRSTGLAISNANEELIRSCQLLIANLTPFRGPSADVGTAYELGFARALGRPVFGYTNSPVLLSIERGNFLGAAFIGQILTVWWTPTR